MPFFGDLAKLFTSQGPVNWDIARQMAAWGSSEGQPEGNVDPVTRIRLEELARVAELHVGDATGLPITASGRAVVVRPVTRSQWAAAALDAYRPYLERLSSSLGQLSGGPGSGELGEEPDPATQLLGNLGSLMTPLLLGMQSGFMVGHLARRSLGQYDLPLPWPASDELLVIAGNVDEFASDWSVPADDVRLLVCLDVITHHAVLNRPHVRARITELVLDYASAFTTSGPNIEERFGGIDPSDPSSWESALGDPSALVGAMQSDIQRALQPQLEAVVAAVEGYVDHVLDTVGGRLISSYRSLTEALRRRRVERNQGDKFVEQMFGLELSQKQYDRGSTFVEGIFERHGEDGLARLWHSERELPTPAEVDAPGLWWERINLPED
jgi:putative hydrolase